MKWINASTCSLSPHCSTVEVAFMDFKEVLSWMIRTKQNTEWFSVKVWSIWTYRIQVRTNQPWCNPNQLANIAKKLLTEFQVVQQPSQPQSTLTRVHWRAPILDMVKVNFDDALFSWEQKSGVGVVLARCFSKLHYSHVKREGNMVAYILALFTLNVSNYNTWMEDAPPQFLSSSFF